MSLKFQSNISFQIIAVEQFVNEHKVSMQTDITNNKN